MEKFPENPSTAYVVAETKRKANSFAKRKGMGNYVAVTRVEDLPRKRGILVVLLKGYDKLEDYELLFGTDGLFYIFKATIYYEHEVPALH